MISSTSASFSTYPLAPASNALWHAVRLPEAGDHHDLDTRVVFFIAPSSRPVGFGHHQVHQHLSGNAPLRRQRVEPACSAAAVGRLTDHLDPAPRRGTLHPAAPLVVVHDETRIALLRSSGSPSRTRGASVGRPSPRRPRARRRADHRGALPARASRRARAAGAGPWCEADTSSATSTAASAGLSSRGRSARGRGPPGVLHTVVERLLHQPVGVSTESARRRGVLVASTVTPARRAG